MTSGLGRFVGAEAARARQPASGRCELCAELVPDESDGGPGADHGGVHRHVVDLHRRRLLCTCVACALLFVRSESGGGRFRAVPDRVLRDDTAGPSTADWDALQIPVGIAFFLRRGDDESLDAFYPSPAGATECLLDLDAWRRMAGSCPVLGQAEPDVEAVLARRGEAEVECFVVPIDVCYELVGLLRLHWRGFDGGEDARRAVAAFFGRLRTRGEPYPAALAEAGRRNGNA